MDLASMVAAGIVAALEAYFMILEMFLWATPFGVKTFKRPLEELQMQKVLAANQGLYNGFLSAGLVWSLVAATPIGIPVRIFFLSCVLVAGLYGGATASRGILFVQALPAAIALAFTLLR